MVAAIRRGLSFRKAAKKFRFSISTAHFWFHRAAGKRPDQIDWDDQSHRPHRIHRVARAVEKLVLSVRRQLKGESALGEYGAAAIHKELISSKVGFVPSVRTIGRILERHGALDGRHRIRRPAPPRGWYLPDVAAGKAELDTFDVVEGLVIQGGIDVEVLTGLSLHGALPAAWPLRGVTAVMVATALVEHWREFGLPTYAQFDNDTRFQGAHHWADSVGRVTRLCLSLNVTPVFVPPREMGFQAALESFNGRWQQKVWRRFHFTSLQMLQTQSRRYIEAYRSRNAARMESAPWRRPFPGSWKLNLQSHPSGRIIFLRRTTEAGRANVLGNAFLVDRDWPRRLVRAEVDLDNGRISFFALRRRDSTSQPLIRTVEHDLPQKRFIDTEQDRQ